MPVPTFVGTSAPAFTLPKLDGSSWDSSSKPANGTLLLVFFETDCPTCALALPYLNRLHTELADLGNVCVAVSQDDLASTRKFCALVGLEFPVLCDGNLDVSRLYDPVTVPAFFLLDADGTIQQAEVGFNKAALNSMASVICRANDREPVIIAPPHDGQPDWKPGCGSRHLELPSSGAPRTIQAQRQLGTTASRIELGDGEDPCDYCLEHGFDPLPVIPPSQERVARMLGATHHSPDEIIGCIPPCYGEATVEKIAANAVMAGCQPEMMKVVISLVRAACDERLNLHGFQATTHFAAPLVIVNGPVRSELGFASAQNVMSNVARANSTLGRAFQLILRNLGGADPLSIDMSALGNPGKFSYCIAENEEASPWEPLHVERGFDAEQSTVSVCAAEAPRGVSEHTARTAKPVLRAIAHALATVWNYRVCLYQQALVIIGPEHATTLASDGYSKRDVRNALFEMTGVPMRLYDEDEGEGTKHRQHYEQITIDGEPCYRKFRNPEAIQIAVAGGQAGKFSAVLGGWGRPVFGSEMVTYPIQ